LGYGKQLSNNYIPLNLLDKCLPWKSSTVFLTIYHSFLPLPCHNLQNCGSVYIKPFVKVYERTCNTLALHWVVACSGSWQMWESNAALQRVYFDALWVA